MNKQYYVIIILVFIVGGCTSGHMKVTSYSQETGWTKEVYSPFFVSDSIVFSEKAEFRISTRITRKVEPITYTLKHSIGLLDSSDMYSKASSVIHLKNESRNAYDVEFKRINILNREFFPNLPVITLRPGEKYDTSEFNVRVGTYDTELEAKLTYVLNGEERTHVVLLKRQKKENGPGH